MSMSPNRPTTQELEDWCEMLMRYLMRYEVARVWPKSTPVFAWQKFKEAYPPVAAEMEEWLERQHAGVSMQPTVPQPANTSR